MLRMKGRWCKLLYTVQMWLVIDVKGSNTEQWLFLEMCDGLRQ